MDYLADEVLEGLPPDRRDFLLRTSVLSRLTGAPLRRGRRGRRLGADPRRARALNPFLVPLDNRREWYRYHHLFGELLQHERR